jgi:hypothetical protein
MELNREEVLLHWRKASTDNIETRGGLTRSIGDVRVARGILDDPNIPVRTFDPAKQSITEQPFGLDPNQSLSWDGLPRNVEFYRPDGTRGSDLDLSFRNFDIEIKLGERAEGIAGKVRARNKFLHERADMPYYLASEIPPDVIAKWQAHSSAIPLDIKAAARNGFDGHIQVTPDMRGGIPYFLRDLLSPEALRYVLPSVGTGKK